jgi:hypothetical protein
MTLIRVSRNFVSSIKAGDKMSAWLQASGPAVEKALMTWKNMPGPRTVKFVSFQLPSVPSSVFVFPLSAFGISPPAARRAIPPTWG